MNLETSIRAGDLAAASDLLRAGADPSRQGADGLTPLMIASGLGQSQMVELLLTAGAAVLTVEPRMGATALHKAAQSNNADVIRLLIDSGAFIDQQSPKLGNTALMDAVLHKGNEAVRQLLDSGAKTTLTNHWQQTALDLAREDGLDVIVSLIEARDQAVLERVSAQTLMTAVKSGDIDEVKRLIAAGALLNERAPVEGGFDDDYTPLGLAARDGHVEIVRALLDAGADIRRVIGLMQGTAVHDAAYFGRVEIIRALTQEPERAGAPTFEIDAQGAYNGLTALHDAVWHGHLEAARELVTAGASLSLTTHAGLTPRELAQLYGYNDIARFLAEAEHE